jgi:FlaA1/EpsC-like NDP-sugar epimerase
MKINFRWNAISIIPILVFIFRNQFFFRSIKIACRLPKVSRRYILFCNDAILFLIAFYISLSLRFEELFSIRQVLSFSEIIMFIILVKFLLFSVLGMYRPLLRYTGLQLLETTLKSVVASTLTLIALDFLLGLQHLPKSVYVIDALLTLVLIVGLRFCIRYLLHNADMPFNSYQERVGLRYDDRSIQQVVIYGAGAAGFQLYQALSSDRGYEVVAFIDDDPNLQDRAVNGTKIYHLAYLKTLISQHRVRLVLLAIPSAKSKDRSRILNALRHLPVEVRTIPTISELLSGRVSIRQIRKVDIADLLGREEVLPDPSLLRINVTGKSVLVTGAGGSIGSELCRQIACQNPQHLILYELNEFALYTIDLELSEKYPHIHCTACLGTVTNAKHLQEIFTKYHVDTIYHAAAYKHVPLVENNPMAGIVNNICGTLVTACTASDCGVETFVLISTDKAVRPTSIMGASKRVAELILQALAAKPEVQTRFMMVRFGNVLDSNGSVVPRFRNQIALGQSITLTHPDMTRYFMSIPEASRLVLQAGAMGQGGEVFLLDMGEPVKIYDLAVQMIELSDLVPGKDIEIEITGLRPGEKLYEELLIGGDNVITTSHPKIYAAREMMIPWNELEPSLDQLFLAAHQIDTATMLFLLKKLVPEYSPLVPISDH